MGGFALVTGLPLTVSSTRAPSSLWSKTKSTREPAAGASAATAASASRLQTTVGIPPTSHSTWISDGEPCGSSAAFRQPNEASQASNRRRRGPASEPFYHAP